MDKRYSVSFATGSRADYGIVRRYLKLLDDDESVDLSILVTGSLLSSEYGHQVDLIRKDGFTIDAEIDIDLNSNNNASILHSMAIAEDKFGQFFEKHQYDLLIILGDRYEMLSVATAAAMQRIPILHLHGGEATFGNYDEFIRHAITKMSLYHFTATEEYRQRVIQLGESPERVFYLGALGAENCTFIEEDRVYAEIKDLPHKRYFTVLFHPETLTNVSVVDQVVELLEALDVYTDYVFVFLGSNADTHSNDIRERIKKYVEEHDNSLYFENLPTAGYHYLLKNSIGLIGNSSSGIIEAPSLGIQTINIGSRQDGRVRGNSVHDVPCEKGRIREEIRRIIDDISFDITNPYFKPDAARNYFLTTKKLLGRLKHDIAEPKRFYDVLNSVPK